MPQVHYAWHTPVNNPAAPDNGNGPGSRAAYPQHQDDGESWWWGAYHRARQLAAGAYHATGRAIHEVEDTAVAVAYVAEAIYIAKDYAPGAIKEKLGIDVQELERAFIPGLLMSLGLLAVTTLIGATAAGLLAGALSGGTLAVPAAIAGGELGLDAGFLILDAMGILFLLRDLIKGLPQIFEHVRHAVNIAWNAGADKIRPPNADVERAAHGLAVAAAEMTSLVMEGVLVWILSKSSAARRGALTKGVGDMTDPAILAARGRELVQNLEARTASVEAALKSAASELAQELRKARTFTASLGDFVEQKISLIVRRVTEAARRRAEDLKLHDGGGDLPAPPWKGPTNYSSLENPRGAGPGKRVTTLQKQKMFDLNRQQNSGLLRDDVTGEVLVPPQKSVSGVTPPANEAQIDHIQPMSQGGTNEYDNLQVRSRAANRAKSDSWDSGNDQGNTDEDSASDDE